VAAHPHLMKDYTGIQSWTEIADHSIKGDF